MDTPNRNSLTIDTARITPSRFTQILKDGRSPAYPYADVLFNEFIRQGVEPAFALAQFRVESQYGTSGHAAVSGSWGNMLYDRNLCDNAVDTYSPGNGYTYAVYDSYWSAVKDYCTFIHWYKDQYGLDTIYGATARWIGRAPGSAGHISYVDTIVNDMIDYQFAPGQFFETGDVMIVNTSGNFNRDTGRMTTKYPIKNGMVLYRGTDGVVFKTFNGIEGNAWFAGVGNGSNEWGAVFIRTVASPQGQWVYIKNIDPTKIIKV